MLQNASKTVRLLLVHRVYMPESRSCVSVSRRCWQRPADDVDLPPCAERPPSPSWRPPRRSSLHSLCLPGPPDHPQTPSELSTTNSDRYRLLYAAYALIRTTLQIVLSLHKHIFWRFHHFAKTERHRLPEGQGVRPPVVFNPHIVYCSSTIMTLAVHCWPSQLFL